MAVEQFKNVIIGSGEGGKSLAWHFGEVGEQAIVIERRYIGGSCPNTNCLPSKNEVWSAKVAELIRHAKQFGSNATATPIDMTTVRNRKRAMVDALIKIHVDKYQKSGVELLMGEARFIAPKTLEVQVNGGGMRTISGERIFLNLGTKAAIPPTPGLAESKPITHVEILELDRLPEHLIVIGGGYIGLEFAQAYRRFGSRVTIVQHGPHLLARQDADVIEEVTRFISAGGIDIIAPAEITRVQGRSGDAVKLHVQTSVGERIIDGTDILVATGRTPNTRNIGLDIASVELDARGYLKVNDRLETTAPGIWGIGEVAGSPQFTHVSYDDYRIIRDNLVGGHRSTSDRLIPSCLYTDPPVAHIGLTETEAEKQGIAYTLAKIPIGAVLRTRTIDETEGFMKALIHPKDNRILGFTMIGPEAGEVMGVVQVAMMAKMPAIMLRDAVLAHPTMAEGLNVLFSSVELKVSNA